MISALFDLPFVKPPLMYAFTFDMALTKAQSNLVKQNAF